MLWGMVQESQAGMVLGWARGRAGTGREPVEAWSGCSAGREATCGSGNTGLGVRFSCT